MAAPTNGTSSPKHEHPTPESSKMPNPHSFRAVMLRGILHTALHGETAASAAIKLRNAAWFVRHVVGRHEELVDGLLLRPAAPSDHHRRRGKAALILLARRRHHLARIDENSAVSAELAAFLRELEEGVHGSALDLARRDLLTEKDHEVLFGGTTASDKEEEEVDGDGDGDGDGTIVLLDRGSLLAVLGELDDAVVASDAGDRVAAVDSAVAKLRGLVARAAADGVVSASSMKGLDGGPGAGGSYLGTADEEAGASPDE